MPTYDYRCTGCGDFDKMQRMVDHAWADCPTCGSDCKQVLKSAPGLDLEAMARAGMPGAYETVGDRIHKRHIDAGQ